MPTQQEPDSITEYVQDTTYVPDALAAFYVQFQNKPALQGLLTAYMNRVQEIENAFWQLLMDCSLDNAVGDALDQLGRILNFLRGILTDDEYRIILKAVVRARQSSGTGDDVLATLLLALGSTFPFTYAEGFASILITPHQTLPVDGSVLLSVLDIAKSGGVQLELETPPVADGLLFEFAASGLYNVTGDSVQGFSDTSQVTGGQLQGVVGPLWVGA